jgi:aryl-alcohol dehydrogenase-like predicted oxidoreductase
MQQRVLGSGKLAVSELGLGCMGLTSWYGVPAAENEAIRLIHRAIDLGVTFFDTAEAYGPFTNEKLVGRGFLTGEIKSAADLNENDYRRTDPRFQGENFTRNFALVEQVRKLASQKNATPGQMALAWLLSKGNDIVPIPGTKRLSYLEENIAATQITLSAQEIAQLEATVGPVTGARYTQDRLRQISRD